MGDMADELLDIIFDISEGEDPDPEDGGRPSITCKYCLSDGFHWRKTEHGWRLFDYDGHLHACKTTHGVEKGKA